MKNHFFSIMKTKKLFLLPALIAALNLLLPGQAPAQTFTTLHSFTDWATPRAGLVLSNNKLYGTTFGTTSEGDSLGYVFAVSTDGTGFTTLHYGPSPGGVILSDNRLYWTAFGQRSSLGGSTVSAGNTDGTGGANLHTFAPLNGDGSTVNADGTDPTGLLILSGNTLYGTASLGGGAGGGTVFAVSTDGTGFTVLRHFFWGSPNSGEYPLAGLILSGDTLYGTTAVGGSSGPGTVFALNTNGTGFTILHSFNSNSDGGGPRAGLILSGNTLYGTAEYGGAGGAGTVFAVNRDGTGFRVLHHFPALSERGYGTNSDGGSPRAGLILSGNTLYGTAYYGGASGNGTVFAVNTNGTGFTSLYSFSNQDGANPQGTLALSENTLYGTTSQGGGSGGGTVFSLSIGDDSDPNIPPTVSISSPPDGATYAGPAVVEIDVEASDSDGSVARVEFYAGDRLLASDSTAPFEISWENVPPGNYLLTADAFDNVGAMSTSAPVNISVAAPPAPPLAPSGLTAAAVSRRTIKLHWIDHATDETSYKIERSKNGLPFTEIAVVGANVTQFADRGLAPGKKYFYRVRAANAVGDSAYSNTAKAKTLP